MPTIDELLKYMDRIDPAMPDYCKADNKAIRAILEQHRDSPSGWIPAELMESEKREAIRAFVERVRWRCNATTTGDLSDAITAELAAMEKANAGTND